MSELVKRSLSGAVYVACVVGSILWNEWAFSGLFLFCCLLGVDEFHRLVKSSGKLRLFAFFGTLVLWALLFCIAWHPEDGGDFKAFGWALGLAYMPIIVCALLDEIWNHSEQPLQNWGNFLISQTMIAAPLATLVFLNCLDKWLLLALFVLIWVNDTGAYCVGSLTAKRKNGNHKMAPHVSPKKSWEGLFGGIILTFLASYVLFRYCWFEAIQTNLPGLLISGLFALFVSTFGTMGDLMESLFKRSIGVKDSGKFLPGHGGVLDRFDSVLLASPVITVYCWLCYFAAPLL